MVLFSKVVYDGKIYFINNVLGLYSYVFWVYGNKLKVKNEICIVNVFK